MTVKNFFKEALTDIDGYASSKRLTLLYLLLLTGVLYIAHATCFVAPICHAPIDGLDHLVDLIKINLAAISSEHLPRIAAAFKSGTVGSDNDGSKPTS